MSEHLIDTRGIDLFLQEAATHYAATAPAVMAHVEDLYLRFTLTPEQVSLAELLRVLALREGGLWEAPHYAANRIYHLRHDLRMDTAGMVDF